MLEYVEIIETHWKGKKVFSKMQLPISKKGNPTRMTRGESFCSTLVEVVAGFVQGRLQKLTEVLPESELVFRKGMFQKNIHHSLIDRNTG